MELPRYRSKDDFVNDKWISEQLKLIPFHERDHVCDEYSRIYFRAGSNEQNVNAKTCTATRSANTYLRKRVESGSVTEPIVR